MGRRTADDGSLPLAMLLTVVGIGLSVVLATMVNVQQVATRGDVQRADAINAAQAGIDVAVAQIRAATSGGAGDLTKLPLACGGTLLGTVTDNSASSYETSIVYLPTSPVNGVIGSGVSALQCVAGVLPGVPLFALISSKGRAAAGGITRTLSATYSFSSIITNPHIAGGLMRVRRENSPVELCMAAPVDTLIGGEPLWVRPCDTSSRRQKFAYEASLNIVLVSSRTPANPRGMCLDGGSPEKAGNTVTFEVCAASPVTRQMWGQNDYSAFQGTTDGINLNSYCMTVSVPGSSSIVTLGDSSTRSDICYDSWSEEKTFFPDAEAGTGRAGALTDQLVNSDQFGRCIDVTADDVTSSFLVIFPCKQKPSGAVQWNQVWVPPAMPTGATSTTGPIHTTYNGIKYCLTSPGTIAAFQYVTVTACPAGATPPNMTWVYRLDTGIDTTSNRIESRFGAPAGVSFCLSPTDPAAAAPDLWTLFGQTFSKLVLATCTDSDLQKWNVSPAVVSGPLKDVVEK